MVKVGGKFSFIHMAICLKYDTNWHRFEYSPNISILVYNYKKVFVIIFSCYMYCPNVRSTITDAEFSSNNNLEIDISLELRRTFTNLVHGSTDMIQFL